MPSRLSILPLLCGLFSVLLPPCTAQEAKVELQLLTFPKTMEILSVELLLGDGKTREIEVSSNELSPVLVVPRVESWVFGKTVQVEGQNPSFKTFGQARAIAAEKQIVLLIRNGREMAEGLEVRPIAGDKSNFGGGGFLFVNAAKVDIAGEAGGEKFAIKPGRHAVVKPKLDGDGGLIHAMFYFRMEDQPRPFFSSKWPVSDRTRGLIFFYHDPDTQRLRLHTIRNFIEQ